MRALVTPRVPFSRREFFPLLCSCPALAILARPQPQTLPGPVLARDDVELTGTWSDACPCKIPCPCWSKGRSSTAQCANIQVFRLDGHLGALLLRNLVCVLINHSLEPFEQPVPRVLYVDESGGRELGEATFRFFRGRLGRGPTDGVRLIAIQGQFSPRVQRVTIPGILDYEVCAAASGSSLGLDRDLRDHLYPWLQEPEQWIARKVNLHLDKEKASYEGTNAISARFVYDAQTGWALNPAKPAGALYPALRQMRSGDLGACRNEQLDWERFFGGGN